MRMVVFLITAIFAASLSFFASADGSRGTARTKPAQNARPAPNSLCAKKIALGPGGTETGCLMQKRKGRS